VDAISGAVVTSKSSPILILLCGFCREYGLEYFYDDDFFEGCLWCCRSNGQDGGSE
jgi:hypothetical protein